MQTELLLQLCQNIGIEDDKIINAEAFQRYHLAIDIPAGRVKRISHADLNTLNETFGDALTLKIGIPNSPLVDIEQGKATLDIADGLKRIANLGNTFDLRFDLDLDKRVLLRQYYGVNNQIHSLLYFFKKNLDGFLRSPLLELDSNLFADRYQPTLVVTTDTHFLYAGPLLIIAGQNNLQDAMKRLLPINQNLRKRIDKYHATVTNSLNWAGFHLEHLTPLHFLCRRLDGDAKDFDSLLANHLLHLSLLYTANRSSYFKDHFEISFASSERTATLELEIGEITLAGEDMLSRLVLWPHSEKETDRLTILQNVIARELESDDPKENYRSFVRQLRHIFEEVRWHHRVFLDGQIDKHFEQIEKVNSYISGVAKEVSQTLDTVTKGFTDTLLATVGLITLTLLASLIENKTQGAIFRIGMQAYAVYLLLFQVCYRMGSIWHSYFLLTRETDTQLAVYANKLGQSRVGQLLAPLTSWRNQFLLWFWLTVGIYLIVIVLIWLLGNNLPQYLVQQGIVSPVSTPVPTSTP